MEKCEVLVKGEAEHYLVSDKLSGTYLNSTPSYFIQTGETYDELILQQNFNRHKRVELWAKSILNDFGNFGRHFSCASSPKNPRRMYELVSNQGDGAICSKNRKIVPYHGASPNTRNGARLRSPSPIMAPVVITYFFETG